MQNNGLHIVAQRLKVLVGRMRMADAVARQIGMCENGGRGRRQKPVLDQVAAHAILQSFFDGGAAEYFDGGRAE